MQIPTLIVMEIYSRLNPNFLNQWGFDFVVQMIRLLGLQQREKTHERSNKKDKKKEHLLDFYN